MSIIPITIYGDKILRETAKPVKQVDDRTIKIIMDMFETMRHANGVGLAANQVGLNEKIFVIDVSVVEGYENIKPVAMINPQILDESDETIVIEEGCLSLPNLRVDIERPKIVKVRYLDTDEKEQEIEADEFFARVILHEYDHLIGKMMPDRVEYSIRKKLKDELDDIRNRKVKVDYPITEK